LKQSEAAEMLQVSVRTIQRRWHAALLKLDQIFHGGAPGA
ncbi:MAG: sigma-70 family RNA polymerase sigma factor, partial [Nitrospira sp.]|nr:sigma-70 family RNA polymerase sigma factor [Nitrospira sp.]